MVDDFLDPKENNNSKFSMLGKARHLSVQSAKHKIDNIRRHKGQLINASHAQHDDHMDNIFINSSKGGEAYTLSVYNRAEKFTRP